MAKYIVQHRRGTAEQWAANDTIIPKSGEIVIEIDEENSLHKLKIGDGTHTYAELAYLTAGDDIVTQVLSKALPRVTTITLDVSEWLEVTCETDPNLGYYKQPIYLDGITAHSRLDLQPDADMLAEFQSLNLVFVTENKDGVISVYSVGDMPFKSYTMQATIVETDVVDDKDEIVGMTVGAPTPHIVKYIEQTLTEEQKAQVRTNIGVEEATSTNAGLMSSGDKEKLDSIVDNANNYTHPIYTERSSGLYKIIVDEEGHVSDAIAVEKADITNLGIPAQDTTYSVETDGDGNAITSITKSGNIITATKGVTFIPESQKGAAGGVATLDENSGKVPSAQLPSYVDDVLEYNEKSSFPTTGESGKIYIDTSTNITYRWSGSIYTAIGSDLALGETSSTAYYGDKGKTAYLHSQIINDNPHGITKSMLGVVDTYTNPEPLLNNVGGILATNHQDGFTDVLITDLITELLYPYTAPVINSFSLNPSAGAKEMNVPITVNTATVKVTKKSKSIESVSLYRGDTLLQTKTDDIASSGTTLTFTLDDETLDGSADTSYQVKVTETSGAVISSGKQTYDFVYPYFYGIVTNGTTINSDIILGFTKSVRTKGNHSYNYTTENQCPVIAYPKSYGELKSIIDPNNFTQNWTNSVVKVNNDSTIKDVEYYVYVGGAATATATYKFNY